MKRSISSAPRTIRGLLRDRTGATAILFGFMAVGLDGHGRTDDRCRARLRREEGIRRRHQAAALAGAHALSQTNATQGTVRPPSRPGTRQIRRRKSRSPTPASRFRATPRRQICRPATARTRTSPTVTQTATVSTHFIKAFGFPRSRLRRPSAQPRRAARRCPLNVMFVLDATGSMNSADTGCTVPGIAHPTRFQCAIYSIQSVLKMMPTSMDKVGLMIFPGMATQYSPTSHPCPTQPNSTPYSRSQHQVSDRHRPRTRPTTTAPAR